MVPLLGLQVGLTWTWYLGPYLGIIGTLFLCMAYRLASPGHCEWGGHLGLTHAW